MRKKIFATGMGGCVGHYLYDELKKNDEFEFAFLIRSPEKVKYDTSKINVIKDEFKNIKKYAEIIKDADYIIHLLADWGGEEGNFQETIDFFNCIDANKTEKILYFSTASILGKDNKPNVSVKTCGTPYIRGKYKFYEKLLSMPHYKKTVILYLTWVLGGDKNHPYSHAYYAIKSGAKFIDIIKFFSVDINFHFIHSKDIAQIAYFLLKNDTKEKEFILGNEPITADIFIEKMCQVLSKNNPKFKINFPIEPTIKLAKFFGKKFSDWDEYCIGNRKLTFNVVNPASFGLAPYYPKIEKILEEIFQTR